MARIRTIKPDFWTDEKVGECSVSARLLLIACLNFSDDHGGLDRSAKQLKAQAFPYDQIDCEPLVVELINVGILIEYEVDGKKYLHIKGFQKHQKVEKPARPRIPIYEPSGSPRGGLGEESPSSSGSSLGREGKGREERGRARENGESAGESGEGDHKFESARIAAAQAGIDPQTVLAVGKEHPDKPVAYWIATALGRLKDIARIDSAPATEAANAWSALIATDGAERPGRTAAALDAIGGWLTVRGRTPFTEPKLRAEFCRAYSEAAA